jgi:hypothetical protein
MHSRRFCALLLGGWIAGSLVTAWVASHNLTSVEAHASISVKRIREEVLAAGEDRVRGLFRLQAAELNRYYFEHWELAQLAIGLLLGVILLFATNGNRLMMAAWLTMYVIVLFQHFALTPRMIELGRGLDLSSIDEFIDERKAFQKLHAFYGWNELAKGLAALVLGARLLVSRGPASGRRRRSRIDEVNNANDSHVNG